jgi:hypothetical protein
MSRLSLVAVVVALGLARTALAHSPTPASILEALNAPEARAALGVQRAEQDAKNPRVLVVRVDRHWFELDRAERLLQARIWRDDWRRAVVQGVVAVLDARTDLPVIGYAPGGTVFLRDVPPGVQRTD